MKGTAEITRSSSIFEQLKIVFRRNLRQYAILMALIAIIIIFQIATNGILLKLDQCISSDRTEQLYTLIMAIGMTLCILTGGNIDLSVGSIVAFVSACSALFSVTWGLTPGLSIILGLLMGLLAGGLAGVLDRPCEDTLFHRNPCRHAPVQRSEQPDS